MATIETSQRPGVRLEEVATIPRDKLFDIIVDMLRVEDNIKAERGHLDELGKPISELWGAGAFGPMYRDCDLGLSDDAAEAANCTCQACTGGEMESATPLFHEALTRAARAA